MKVFWVENEKGEVYGNARWFTKAGPPKLYGSVAKLRAALGTASRWATEDNPPGTLPDHMIICEGTLTKVRTHG